MRDIVLSSKTSIFYQKSQYASDFLEENTSPFTFCSRKSAATLCDTRQDLECVILPQMLVLHMSLRILESGDGALENPKIGSFIGNMLK